MNDPNFPTIVPPHAPQHQGQIEPEAQAEQNPLLLVHHLLRGRYIIAGVLAAVFGAIGLGVGYQSVSLEYESTALVRIAPVLPRVMYETDHTGSLPMFSSFMQTQVALINSRRVVEMAMQRPDWRAAGGEFSLEAMAAFQRKLQAGLAGRGSELIRISFIDEDPTVARTAVKAVTEAYLSVYEETDLVSDTQRMRILEDRERTLTNEIESLSSRILDIANEYGTSTLDKIYNLKVEELHGIRQDLERARVELSVIEARLAGEEADKAVQMAEVVTLTEEQIALRDGRMQRLLDSRRQVEFQIEDFEVTYREPMQFPEYRRALRRLESQNEEIQRYADQYRETFVPRPIASEYNIARSIPTEDDANHLRSRIEQLEVRQAEAQAEMQTIGRRNVQIERLRAERSRAQDYLSSTRHRIEALNLEATVGGRISLMAEPETPTTPSNARARMQRALMGGAAGGGLGVGLILLLGFFNMRVRDTEDAERVKPSLLGVLPQLPERLADPGEALIAAQCVHHIRTMLQSAITGRRDSVIAITSAASGSGKTSLVLSLGISYALAGARTLLIDGDAIGQGLSRRTGAVARKRIGALLCEYGIISRSEAKRALEESYRTGERLGQVLLKQGLISNSDLEEVLSMQKELRYGLADAVNGRPLPECIADIGIDNLAILPAGDDADTLVNCLSPDAISPLIDRLRGDYDMILLDTGPVPGTTDSSVVAAAADGVILVVSRGDMHSNVHRTIQHLQRVQAPLTGVVMNRASTRDIERSGHSSSMSGDASEPRAARLRKRTKSTPSVESFAEYGPLPSALLSMSKGMTDSNGYGTDVELAHTVADNDA